MNMSIASALTRLVAGQDVSTEEMRAAIAEIMDGRAGEAETAALLTALRMKGESVEEIVGAARAMLDRAARIEVDRQGLLDTCGTGGDNLQTFNISTATAFVAAAAGVPVAKHGNRGVSSSSGSSDVLDALGVNIRLEPQQVARCIEEVGIGFCFAPLFHEAIKHAAPIRKRLGFRTIFNLLGPLTNPAGAEFQLLGASRVETAEKLAEALVRLGRRRALVVCGNDELDEVSLWGETAVLVVAEGSVSRQTWTAGTLGLPSCRVEDLTVHSPQASAAVIRDVFAGQAGPARDMVLANTAAALIAADRTDDPKSAVGEAALAIDSGGAVDICARLVEWTTRRIE